MQKQLFTYLLILTTSLAVAQKPSEELANKNADFKRVLTLDQKAEKVGEVTIIVTGKQIGRAHV